MAAPNDMKEVVREKYGQAALRAQAGQASCCGTAPSASSCCGTAPSASSSRGAAPTAANGRDPITSNLYDAKQAARCPTSR